MEQTYKKVNGKVVWKPNNHTSKITFSNPKRMGRLTKSFVKYIINNQISGKKSTKRGFYKYIGREYSDGHNSHFFGSIKDSGIVKMERVGREFHYTIGDNFHHYLNGDLVRYSFRKHGHWKYLTDMRKSIGKELQRIGESIENYGISNYTETHLDVVNGWINNV